MIDSQRRSDLKLRVELQNELRRLDVELERAIAARDRADMIVDSGDDSGHVLITALATVRRLEDRIDHVRKLLAQETARPDGMTARRDEGL